jgi:hypothetical protein
LRLLCPPFHQHFPSYFFTPSIFPGSAQADLVPFAAAVSTAEFIYLRVLCVPYGFLLTPSIFPGSAQADLVLFAAAVSTANHQISELNRFEFLRFKSTGGFFIFIDYSKYSSRSQVDFFITLRYIVISGVKQNGRN